MFDPDAQLLHLVAHYALQHQASGVRWLYDVALLLARCGERIHWETVCRAASEFGIACALLHTLEEVEAVWKIALPSASLNPLGSLHPSYRERAIFSTLSIPQRGVAIIWHALTTPGARNKLTFLAHRVFPAPAYMVERYQLASTRHCLRHTSGALPSVPSCSSNPLGRWSACSHGPNAAILNLFLTKNVIGSTGSRPELQKVRDQWGKSRSIRFAHPL
ncbi:MAG: nucleotidyltransferase family protein [Anaerolineales bacterium]|nr:nucleotidyltransferase family protein [Anaerolineales bacterium]